MKFTSLQCFARGDKRKNLPRVVWLGLLVGGCSASLFAQNPGGGASEKVTFSGILQEHTAKTFSTVKTYVEQHPEASDGEQAYEWLFNTARKQGWEEQTLPIANRYLNRTEKPRPWKDLAVRVRTVGNARAGEWEDALLDYESQLTNVRLRMPTETVELAKTLAREAQIAGRLETAREIYRSLSRTLFLNPDIKQLCETKLAKLELVGKKAPAVTVKDLTGEAIDLASSQGKWVLLDFWATNCPPCIKDLPVLLRLYETHHPAGLEIIGISLDEDADTVRDFQKQRQVPWTLALSSTDGGKTREAYHVPTIPAMYLIDPKGNVELMDPNLGDLERLLPKRLKSGKNSGP